MKLFSILDEFLSKSINKHRLSTSIKLTLCVNSKSQIELNRLILRIAPLFQHLVKISNRSLIFYLNWKLEKHIFKRLM